MLLHGEFVLEEEWAWDRFDSGASEGLVVVRDHQEPARQASTCCRNPETRSLSEKRTLTPDQVAIQVLELDPKVGEARGARTPCLWGERFALLGCPVLLDEGQELLLRIGPRLQVTLDETLDPEAVVLEHLATCAAFERRSTARRRLDLRASRPLASSLERARAKGSGEVVWDMELVLVFMGLSPPFKAQAPLDRLRNSRETVTTDRSATHPTWECSIGSTPLLAAGAGVAERIPISPPSAPRGSPAPEPQLDSLSQPKDSSRLSQSPSAGTKIASTSDRRKCSGPRTPAASLAHSRASSISSRLSSSIARLAAISPVSSARRPSQ